MNKHAIFAVFTAIMFVASSCGSLTVSGDAGEADSGDGSAAIDSGTDSGTDAAVFPDSGPDSGADASADSGMDASHDSGPDAAVPTDSGIGDTGNDAGMDGATDAGFDSGSDASKDAGFDSGYDAGTDAGQGDTGPGDGGLRHFNGYFPTWSENWYDDRTWDGRMYTDEEMRQKSKMAGLGGVYTHLSASFVKPDLSFDPASMQPDANCGETGLQFPGTCRGFAAAIRAARDAGRKVILAVGGASYGNWSGLSNEAGKPIGSTIYKKSLRDLLDYMGADGLDVDYEIEGGPGSAVSDEYAKAIISMREAADATSSGPKILTLAGWSTGADCTAAQFSNPSANTGCSATSYWGGSAGRERDVLSKTIASLGTGAFFPGKTLVGDLIDEISVMSYDARFEHYDAVKAYKLYRAVFAGGRLNIGLEPAPEGWAGGILVCLDTDASESKPGTIVLMDQEGFAVNKPYSVERMTQYVRDNDATGGAMIWNVLKNTAPSGACNPDGVNQVVSEILGPP